jgi:transposase
MNEDSVVYVGVDVAKAKHAIAVAESGRSGEVRYVGEIETNPAAVERFVRKLARKHPRLHFCYEAGPTGYGLYRQLVALGHACEVVAPSLDVLQSSVSGVESKCGFKNFNGYRCGKLEN